LVLATPLTYWPWFFRPLGQVTGVVVPELLVDESFELDEDSESSEDVDELVVTVVVVGTLECESATPWAIARPPPAADAAVRAAAARAVLWAAKSVARAVGFTKSSVAPGRSR